MYFYPTDFLSNNTVFILTFSTDNLYSKTNFIFNIILFTMNLQQHLQSGQKFHFEQNEL